MRSCVLFANRCSAMRGNGIPSILSRWTFGSTRKKKTQINKHFKMLQMQRDAMIDSLLNLMRIICRLVCHTLCAHEISVWWLAFMNFLELKLLCSSSYTLSTWIHSFLPRIWAHHTPDSIRFDMHLLFDHFIIEWIYVIISHTDCIYLHQ